MNIREQAESHDEPDDSRVQLAMKTGDYGVRNHIRTAPFMSQRVWAIVSRIVPSWTPSD